MRKQNKQNTKTTRKQETKGRSFAEVFGISAVVHNEKVDFVVGFIMLCISLILLCAMISFFSTGEADQSLVIQLRPGELFSSSHLFQNLCGSLGALVSHLVITQCFGIAAFLIPFFLILASLKLMKAYNVNLMKWFMGTMITMVWLSVTSAKFLTPIMGDRIYNPGGRHGEMCCQYLEGIIGSPGLLAVLSIVAITFLTYLSSETIAFVRHMLNPVGYLSSKVKLRIIDNDNGEIVTSHQTDSYEDPAAQTVSFGNGIATFSEPDNSEDTDCITNIDEATGEIIQDTPATPAAQGMDADGGNTAQELDISII